MWQKLKPVLSLALFALLLVSPVACFADTNYIMTEAQRTESLQLISSLQQTLSQRITVLNNLRASQKLTQEQLQGLDQTVTQLQQSETNLNQHITDLQTSLNSREAQLTQLQEEMTEIQNILTDSKKLLQDLQKQIKWLVWERNGAVLAFVLVLIF